MNLTERDRKHLWHPFTQMKGAEILPVVKGEGACLYLEDGTRVIDATSSWWTNTYGHTHPYIASKIAEQLYELEHVIFAGFTHKPAVEAAEKLIQVLPDGYAKVFFSDNGSTSVEVALKMAVQFRYNQGSSSEKIVVFEGSYHGDTVGAMSLSERDAFVAPFTRLLFDVVTIPTPTEENFPELKSKFSSLCQSGDICAFVFEPLVQGVRGMKMYSPTHLNELIKIAYENKVITIADEVFTGFGRTGKNFAQNYLSESADIVCLSKGLTAGFMALGATVCKQPVFDAFYDDKLIKAFLHGHSYTGNPLACTAVSAGIDVLTDDNTQKQIAHISERHQLFVAELSLNDKVKEARSLGTILAIELKADDSGYFSEMGKEAYRFFMDRGVLMRPLGNVIFLLPPYCIKEQDLTTCYEAIRSFIS
ncbi:MAG: adenosylmethionine--8-amino-7-oxononanoate transaminase [Flavobacteriales bacterium]